MVYKIVPNDKATRLNDAFNQGKAAAKRGVTVGMCPYSGWRQVEERKSWIEGFESMAYSEAKLWQPSNTTQGDAFIRDWCATCARDYQDSESCDICMRTMAFNITDAEYPKEWRFNEQGEPVCTAYVPEGEIIPVPRDDRTIDMFEDANNG